MATTIGSELYTPDDLLELPDGDRYELVDGRLVEIPISGMSSFIAGEIVSRLNAVIRPDQLGLVFPPDCTYQCFPGAPLKVRRPDVSFIRQGRITLEELEAGHVRVAPDLAVEVISPNDFFEAVDEKVDDYLAASVGLIWIVIPKTHAVWVHRPDRTAQRLTADDELTGEAVLPGFRCRVGDLFLQRTA